MSAQWMNLDGKVYQMTAYNKLWVEEFDNSGWCVQLRRANDGHAGWIFKGSEQQCRHLVDTIYHNLSSSNCYVINTKDVLAGIP